MPNPNESAAILAWLEHQAAQGQVPSVPHITAPVQPEFPDVIDNSILMSFVECPQRCYRTYILGLRGASTNIHLHFGGAFATAVEHTRRAFDRTKSHDIALGEGILALWEAWGTYEPHPDEKIKTLGTAETALVQYFDHHSLVNDPLQPHVRPDGKAAIEYSFAVPLADDLLHPVTGDPLLFAGRADMLGVHTNYPGKVFVVDEKTTGMLWNNWSDQWTIWRQFPGYVWAAQQGGINAVGAYVRGIVVRQYHDHQFPEYPIIYKPWHIQRWHDQTVRDVRRMLACWHEGWWDYNFGRACANRGATCEQLGLCKSSNEEAHYAQFYRKRWDPLTRTETDR